MSLSFSVKMNCPHVRLVSFVVYTRTQTWSTLKFEVQLNYSISYSLVNDQLQPFTNKVLHSFLHFNQKLHNLTTRPIIKVCRSDVPMMTAVAAPSSEINKFTSRMTFSGLLREK